MAGEVVEVAAGGDDVDEAEQRGAQLGVLRRRGPSPCRRAPSAGPRGRREARRRARGRWRGCRLRSAASASHAATIPRRLRYSRHADRRRGRRAHGRRRRRRDGAAPPRPRAARARRAGRRRSRRLGLVRRGRGPRRRRGRAEQAVVCCWTGTGASIAANKVAGRPRGAVRRRPDGRGRTALERRERPRAQPAHDLARRELAEILDAWFARRPERRRRRRGEHRPPRRHRSAPRARAGPHRRARGRAARARRRRALGARAARAPARAAPGRATPSRGRPRRSSTAPGTLWEQAVLPRAPRAARALLLCPANLAPRRRSPRNVVVHPRRRAAARARRGTRRSTSRWQRACCRGSPAARGA